MFYTLGIGRKSHLFFPTENDPLENINISTKFSTSKAAGRGGPALRPSLHNNKSPHFSKKLQEENQPLRHP